MSWTTIERKINHPAAEDIAVLFAPIKMKGFNCYSLQFFFEAIAGLHLPDGIIFLKVSNSEGTGTNNEIPPPDSEFFTVFAGTMFGEQYSCFISGAGDSTSYIFVGLAGGVGNVNWITALYSHGDNTEGTIRKVKLVGDMGNQ